MRNLCRLICQKNNLSLLKNELSINSAFSRNLSLTSSNFTFRVEKEDKVKTKIPIPKRWPLYNQVIKEPQDINQETKIRAEYYHMRHNIKYSPKKMWYISSFVRGLTVDEAVKQLSFITSKGAHIAKEVILEAQKEAINNGFEYKSNMFIMECFNTKGLVIKSMRKHAKYRIGEIRHFYTHFFVKLVEGPPPKEIYFDPNPKNGQEKLDKFIEEMRSKKIENSLF